MFLWQCSIQEMAPFGRFLGPFLSQIWLEFVEKEHTQSWWFWSIFGPNFPPKTPKYCQKPNFFPETSSLWLSNNTGLGSQINHRILIKLIKETIFWGAKYGLFKEKYRPVNKDQEVRNQVSTIFTETPILGLTVGENFLLQLN